MRALGILGWLLLLLLLLPVSQVAGERGDIAGVAAGLGHPGAARGWVPGRCPGGARDAEHGDSDISPGQAGEQTGTRP